MLSAAMENASEIVFFGQSDPKSVSRGERKGNTIGGEALMFPTQMPITVDAAAERYLVHPVNPR